MHFSRYAPICELVLIVGIQICFDDEAGTLALLRDLTRWADNLLLKRLFALRRWRQICIHLHLKVCVQVEKITFLLLLLIQQFLLSDYLIHFKGRYINHFVTVVFFFAIFGLLIIINNYHLATYHGICLEHWGQAAGEQDVEDDGAP